MELLVALVIGALTAVGTYLMLRMRTFPVIVGLSLLAYAVNFFLFASGRLMLNAPPLLYTDPPHTDGLPQALTLTAIVIAFGMTAVAVIMALTAYLNSGTDALDMPNEDPEASDAPTKEPST